MSPRSTRAGLWAREREAPGSGFLPRHAGTRDWLGAANDEWQRKGATLSDKTAGQEFGLPQDEIYDAIDAGTLQYRQAYMHGNPWLRLLRREVEALAGPGTATVTSANSRPGPS